MQVRCAEMQAEAIRILNRKFNFLEIGVNPNTDIVKENSVKMPKCLCDVREHSGLSYKMIKVFDRMEIDCVYHTVWLDPIDMLKCRHVGKKALRDIEDVLSRYGLSFGTYGIMPILKNLSISEGEEYIEIPASQLESEMIDVLKRFDRKDKIDMYRGMLGEYF